MTTTSRLLFAGALGLLFNLPGSGCAQDTGNDSCPRYDDILPEECIDTVAVVNLIGGSSDPLGGAERDNTLVGTCCQGRRWTTDSTAVCDALLADGSFSKCDADQCVLEDPCFPTTALCKGFFDYIHANTEGCIAPTPCTTTCPDGVGIDIAGNPVPIPGTDYRCHDGQCILCDGPC